MLKLANRSAILLLREQGHSIRTIAKALHVCRKTVRKVLKAGNPEVPDFQRPEKAEPYREAILELIPKCKENLVRVHEILVEQGAELSYQALTGFCRRHGIGVQPPTISGSYDFQPGEEMPHSESDMAGLVSCREFCDLPGDRVRRMFVEEMEKADEGSFPENGEQESRDRKIRFVEQCLEGSLTPRAGQGRFPSLHPQSCGEDLDVPRFVRDLHGEHRLHFAEMGMKRPEKTGGNDERRVLVFDEVGHHLGNRILDLVRKIESNVPVYRLSRIPLRRNRLGVEISGIFRPDFDFLLQAKIEFGASRFYLRPSRGKAQTGRRAIQHRIRRTWIGTA